MSNINTRCVLTVLIAALMFLVVSIITHDAWWRAGLGAVWYMSLGIWLGRKYQREDRP